MFEKYIVEQNPHWDGKPLEAGYPRFITFTLKQFIKSRQIVALVGVRRCGKSTVAKQLINYLGSGDFCNILSNLEFIFANIRNSRSENIAKTNENHQPLLTFLSTDSRIRGNDGSKYGHYIPKSDLESNKINGWRPAILRESLKKPQMHPLIH